MFIQYFKRFYSQRHEKTVLKGYVYHFSINYDAIDISDIVNVH